MAEPYLTELKQLAEDWTTADDRIGAIECRHFFSGAAAYRDGTVVASLTPVGLAFRVPAAVRETLLEAGRVTPLRYFPNSPVKSEYVLFPDRGVEPVDAARLILGEHLLHQAG